MSTARTAAIASACVAVAAVPALVAVLVTLLIIDAGHAEENLAAKPGRVHDALAIAEKAAGPVCGGSPVVVQRGALREGRLAQARYSFAAGDHATPSLFYDCTITITTSDGAVHWPRFCTVVMHEYRHLGLWRPAPGEEYVLPDGTLDPLHSRNPRSVMYPRQERVHPHCVRRP